MPDDTHELIDLRQFQALLLSGAALVTLAGLVLAGWWGGLGEPRGRARGLFIAALGPLIVALWFGYNSIVERLGLDSVAALGIHLGIFLACGLALGRLGGRLWEEPCEGGPPASHEAREDRERSRKAG